jgi:Fe2+ transport system protein FeoA
VSRTTPAGLAGCAAGDLVRLTRVNLAVADRLRLAELGLRVGTVVTVTGRTTGGGRIVAFGPSRAALDRRTAESLDGERLTAVTPG